MLSDTIDLTVGVSDHANVAQRQHFLVEASRLAALGMNSYISVVLSTRGRLLGAITFLRTPVDR